MSRAGGEKITRGKRAGQSDRKEQGILRPLLIMRLAIRATLIKKWKPWEQSSGPRTVQGKAHVSQNALKHGNRSTAVINELKEIKKILMQLGKTIETLTSTNHFRFLLQRLKIRSQRPL